VASEGFASEAIFLDRGKYMDNWFLGTGRGIYQSLDGWDWTRVSAYDYGITALVADDQGIFAACGSGLWRVLPGNPMWVQLHDETLTEVMDIARVPGDVGVVAASAYGVATGYHTEDGVVRWRWHLDGLPVNARFTNAIVVDTPVRWVIGTEAGVLVTEDGGDGWQWTNLTGVAVRALYFEKGCWWAGADNGIWMSDDGMSWQRAGKGLLDVAVFDVAVGEDFVVLGTEDGVWRGDGDLGWEKVGLHGQVRAVGVHLKERNLWVAGCVPGGAWVTKDAGNGWSYMPDLPGGIDVVLPPGGGV
jgi:hypothetical protein